MVAHHLKPCLFALAIAGAGPTLLSAPAPKSPSRELRLEDVIADLSTRHPRVRAFELEYSARRASVRFADRTYPDPEVMVGSTSGQMRRTTAFPDPMLEDGATRGTELRVTQPIPFPGRLSTQAAVSALAAELSLHKLRIERNSLVADFLALVADALATRRIRDLARTFANRSGSLLVSTRIRYQAGKGTLSEVANAQVRRDTYRDKAIEAEGQLGARLADLRYYVAVSGRSADDCERMIETSLANGGLTRTVGAMAVNLPVQEARLETVSPELALARAEANRRTKEHTLAKLEYLPDFAVFAGVRREESRSRFYEINAGRERSISFGLSVRVPLWTALSNHNRVSAADLDARAGASETENVLGRVRSTLMAASAEERALDERVRLYRSELIPRAVTARESTRVATETGGAEFSALVGAWDMLYLLETDVVRLEAERTKRVILRARLLDALFSKIDSSRTKP